MKSKIKTAILIMGLMTPSLVFGQSTTNSIYIDQVGDGSNITISQQGQANRVGSEGSAVNIQGNNQNITLTQDGASNSIDGFVNNADNVDLAITNTGDNNAVTLNMGDSASIAGSATTLNVTGSTNTVSLTQGSTSSSSGATQTLNITGDLNTYNSTINADDVTNTVTATGDSNTINMLQNGHAGKAVDMALTGNNNDVTINQRSTTHADTIGITSSASNSTIIINQCNTLGNCVPH